VSGGAVRIEPVSGDRWILTSELELPAPLDEVFGFFSNAHNLERLTPAWLRFSVLTSAPISMHAGTRIDYRLRVRGLPIHWQSEITSWEPPWGFVDEQRRGPYRFWRHEHAFRDLGPTTLVADRVEYAAPLGRLTNGLVVARDLRRIFEFRRTALARAFDPTARPRLGAVKDSSRSIAC
jgi:ligand-binding SRPBCC domain-containing protein